MSDDTLERLLRRAAEAVHVPAQLPAADLEWLLRAGVPRPFRAGERLAFVGETPERVLLLQRGQVRVVRLAPSGKETVMGFRGPGELVGAQAAVEGRARETSVVAVTAVETHAVTLARFHAFLEERPGAAPSLLRVLSGRLREAESVAVALTSPVGAIGRLAVRLLELCERFGEAEDTTISIELPLTLHELAEWSAASTETLDVALRVMSDHGWIDIEPRRIRVLDEGALRRLTFAT